jgi:hypothetical protein
MTKGSAEEDTAMTHGLQQQGQALSYPFTKSCATPQHGQKAPEKPLPVREPRSYKARPGH